MTLLTNFTKDIEKMVKIIMVFFYTEALIKII